MSGVPFAVHLAIADTVNDMHGNEVWLAQETLAVKARCNRRTVRTALAALINAGYLAELDGVPIGGGGRPVRRFRFVMPDGAGTIYEPAFAARVNNGISRPIAKRGNGTFTSPAMGLSRPDNGTRDPINPKEPNKKTQESLDISELSQPDNDATEKTRGKGSDYRFEDAWGVYPCRGGRKIGKQDARKQWVTLSYEDKRSVFRAIRIFAAERPELPPDMHRWIAHGRWRDYLEPPQPGTAAVIPAAGPPVPVRKRWDEMTESEFAAARRGLSPTELTEALDARRRASVIREGTE